MEKEIKKLVPKSLDLTYEVYEQRNKSIQNYCIDNYVVYDLIGVGSYGSVYRGMNDDTKQQVAVKVIDMRLIKRQQNPLIKAIQLRLAYSQPQLMYMCDSPYLLKCYDVFENEDLKILIIEYCNGKTLQAQIQEKKRIPQNEAWIILRQIINGLMVMHSYKIVHRDLKAENIMSHNGTYKIIDFGFSKKLQISQQNSAVRNTSLGTITTMAPEVMGRKPYGLKADIWSLGIIFFQMIYGAYPYDSITAAQMYREIQSKKLFRNEQPFTYNKYTPSKQAYQFLKFTIVVDPEQRPGWKEVAEYPNIKNIRDEDLSQRFLKKCEVIYDGRLDITPLQIQEESNIIKYEQSPKKEEKPKPKIENKVQPQKEVQQQAKKENQQVKQTEISKQIKPSQSKGAVKDQKELKQSNFKKEVTQKQPQYEVLKEEKKKQPRKNKFNLDATMKAEKQEEQRKLQMENKLKEQESKKPPTKNKQQPVNFRKLNNEEIKLKEQEMNQDQDQQYNWVQNAHLECLKTELIFKEIINPLEISIANKKQDRAFIEFFYLLTARCFNNMSPIQDEIDQRAREGRKREMVQNLKYQVQPLYKQVFSKFNQMSTKLTQSEGKMKSMVFDWFSKKLAKDNFERRDKFMTGIQKLEYSKEEQIDFTCSYYDENIKGTLNNIGNVKSTVKRLENYRKLMKVEVLTLRKYNKNFQQYKEMTLNSTQ